MRCVIPKMARDDQRDFGGRLGFRYDMHREPRWTSFLADVHCDSINSHVETAGVNQIW